MNAISGFQTAASPTLRAIMDDTQPARVRLRQVIAQLDAELIAGDYDRLNERRRFGLRCLVFALDSIADQLGEPVAVEKRRPWWRIWP